MLFEVAIVENPTKKDAEDNGAMEKLILPPQFVVAKSTEQAAISAIMGNMDQLKDVDKNRMIVHVRPFTEAGL